MRDLRKNWFFIFAWTSVCKYYLVNWVNCSQRNCFEGSNCFWENVLKEYREMTKAACFIHQYSQRICEVSLFIKRVKFCFTAVLVFVQFFTHVLLSTVYIPCKSILIRSCSTPFSNCSFFNFHRLSLFWVLFNCVLKQKPNHILINWTTQPITNRRKTKTKVIAWSLSTWRPIYFLYRH